MLSYEFYYTLKIFSEWKNYANIPLSSLYSQYFAYKNSPESFIFPTCQQAANVD